MEPQPRTAIPGPQGDSHRPGCHSQATIGWEVKQTSTDLQFWQKLVQTANHGGGPSQRDFLQSLHKPLDRRSVCFMVEVLHVQSVLNRMSCHALGGLYRRIKSINFKFPTWSYTTGTAYYTKYLHLYSSLRLLSDNFREICWSSSSIQS
jgi:hypothetical protein